jgi:hypothetical protein
MLCQTSAKPASRRSGFRPGVFIGYSPEGVSAERRKPLEIEGFGFRPGVFIGYSPEGFLPKAATLLLQRSHAVILPLILLW